MRVCLIEVPFDSAHARARMGRGPGVFVAGGLVDRLRRAGHSVEVQSIETTNPFPTEIATAFELNRQLAVRVRDAIERAAFPVVLSGNCISSAGVVAGLGPRDTGVLWFDAHGDFNTPDTTASGFLDGMALAVVAGACWPTLAGSIPHFQPIPADRLVLAGARDFDPGERERFEADGGAVIDVDSAERDGAAILESLGRRASRVYVHIDLDVLDPAEGTANPYAAPAGLSRKQVHELLRLATEGFDVPAALLSAYDPGSDATRTVLDAGMDFVLTLVSGCRRGARA